MTLRSIQLFDKDKRSVISIELVNNLPATINGIGITLKDHIIQDNECDIFSRTNISIDQDSKYIVEFNSNLKPGPHLIEVYLHAPFHESYMKNGRKTLDVSYLCYSDSQDIGGLIKYYSSPYEDQEVTVEAFIINRGYSKITDIDVELEDYSHETGERRFLQPLQDDLELKTPKNFTYSIITIPVIKPTYRTVWFLWRPDIGDHDLNLRLMETESYGSRVLFPSTMYVTTLSPEITCEKICVSANDKKNSNSITVKLKNHGFCNAYKTEVSVWINEINEQHKIANMLIDKFNSEEELQLVIALDQEITGLHELIIEIYCPTEKYVVNNKINLMIYV